jgi:hypothetical protein
MLNRFVSFVHTVVTVSAHRTNLWEYAKLHWYINQVILSKEVILTCVQFVNFKLSWQFKSKKNVKKHSF